MSDKRSRLSEIGEDIRTVLAPKNVSTMALPWLSFARTIVQIAKEDTRNYTYVNPVNKLVINNYLGASMVLRQTNLGKKLFEQLDVGPGAGKKVFDSVTESWVKTTAGLGNMLEAKEILLTAAIDELQAVRKRADEVGEADEARANSGAAGTNGSAESSGPGGTAGSSSEGGGGPGRKIRRTR